MNLHRLAAGCLVPSFAGPERPDWVRPWLEDGLGGVCLFATSPAHVPAIKSPNP